MKVTAFSDTHGHHRRVVLPESDILIFAGDAMTSGYKEWELIDFIEWYDRQSAEHKIMIAGNHDRFIEDKRGIFLDVVRGTSITYLENSGIEINGLSIWGTPYSKKFMNWAFNKTEPELERIFSNIPDDVDVLVSHAPAFGVLDTLERGEKVGEKTLAAKIDTLPFIRRHIFGHVHCEYGVEDLENYKAMNVSVVNEQYELQNAPVTFKIYPHG